MSSRPHKQSMSELKLRRLTEHNQRLREDLARPRIRVSEAVRVLSGFAKQQKTLSYRQYGALSREPTTPTNRKADQRKVVVLCNDRLISSYSYYR
ncbi:Guanine nucleotide-binding protein subunit gamma [Grifola frondosa]|uniref:Guanine nucleotide-binding protein subunit gamma n=1 Tax=Grifola frondosa TaxID=5627 RepID=A0A1C7MK28_GRIFR|nr:Guanine nucleotide-binding protein subunit gamma [Grifola frondosa]